MARKTPRLFALILVFVLIAPASAFAISRNSVLSRAQSWVDSPVKYSQAKHHLGYRTDCSGYVSMCWKTGTSWSTRTFHVVTRRIKVSQLQPGDALLKKGYHIRLFYGWVDAVHTQYVAYEAGTKVAVCQIHSIAEDLHAKYVPVRYKRIKNSPKSANLLQNGSFDTWAQSWGPSAGQPVWWQVSGSWWQTLAEHRMDAYRSKRNSLQLLDPAGSMEATTDLSQSVRVAAGASYRLTAWAQTPSDPSDVELALTFLDATGQPLAETTTTGDRCGIASAGFARMSVAGAAPAGAITAMASVRLGDGEAARSADGGAPGSDALGASVTLDDIALMRE